jgi:hypothetical protein
MTLWMRYARCLEALLLIKRGTLWEGAATLRIALEVFRENGQTVHYSGYVGNFAEALGAVGQRAEAITTIDDVLALHDRDGQLWSAAELRRVKDALVLQDVERQPEAAANTWFGGGAGIGTASGRSFLGVASCAPSCPASDTAGSAR